MLHAALSQRTTELQLDILAEVRVYLVQIGSNDPEAKTPVAVLDSLSAAEIERAERFMRPGLRGRFIYTRWALRMLLAERLKTTPEDLIFDQTAEGRPYLAQATESNHGIYFNVSHSGDLALIAIGDGSQQIGIDIERRKDLRDLDQMAARVLTPVELEMLGWHADDETTEQHATKLNYFFRYWTLKEAYLKALGTGLQVDMNRIEIALNPNNTHRFQKVPGPTPVQSHEFVPAEGFHASLVLLAKETELALR